MNKNDSLQKNRIGDFFALQYDMTLLQWDLRVYGMKKNGQLVFLSGSTEYDVLWDDALRALKKKFS